MTTNTLPEIKRLHELAKQVRETHETASKLAEATKRKSHEAITEVVLCGKALIEAKELLPHGQFIAWIAEHCGGITRRTASNYMKVAQMGNDSHLNDAKTLNQLYIAAGITTPCTPKQSASESNSEEKPKSNATCESSSTEQTDSNDESEPFQPLSQASMPLQGEQQQPTNDPYSRLRALIEHAMNEIERLGPGCKGAIVEEIMPVIEWAQHNHLI